MGWSSTAQNAGCAAITALGSDFSLHTADPGTSGTGDSGQAHQPTVWAAPAGGTATGSEVTFPDVPIGNYTHYGQWGGATFVQGFALVPPINLTGPANVKVTPSVSFPATLLAEAAATVEPTGKAKR
jgi:hypothetical protein